MSEDKSNRRARGVERAFHILDYLQKRKCALRPNEIAAGIDAPKSTVYNIVNLLVEQGIVEYVDDSGRIFFGRKLYFFGLSYLKNFDLAREAEGYLQHLAEVTHETAQLCMIDNGKYTVVMMKEGIRPFRISSNVGESVPIPWTASGRVLMAHMSDREILDAIPDDDFNLPSGRLDPAAFIAEIRQAARDGFYSSDSVADNFTHCFAAPVRDQFGNSIASLCLVAPRGDAAAKYDIYRQTLSRCADQLSAKLTGEVLQPAAQ
ncbi:MAG: IclR family transcriptional regulator [Alphaproteobacteria bacterium]